MKHEHINYVVVGSFVLVILVTLVTVLALLAGRTGATDSYYAMYDRISGVNFGTAVSYEGYQLGQVEDISPTQLDGGTRYKVSFEIPRGWRIPQDSVARIISSGLLSPVIIDIREGASPQFLPPGSQIAGEVGDDVFASVTSAATDLSSMIVDLRQALQAVSERAAADLPPIVSDVRRLVDRLNESAERLHGMLSEDNEQRVTTILEDLQGASHNFARLATDVNGTLTRIDSFVRDSHTMVTENRGDIEGAVADLRMTLGTVAENVDVIGANLESASRDLREFSRQIRAYPGRLLSTTPPVDDASVDGQR